MSTIPVGVDSKGSPIRYVTRRDLELTGKHNMVLLRVGSLFTHYILAIHSSYNITIYNILKCSLVKPLVSDTHS